VARYASKANLTLHFLQALDAETTREKNLEKAQKETKARARKEGAKSMYLQPMEMQIDAEVIDTNNAWATR